VENARLAATQLTGEVLPKKKAALERKLQESPAGVSFLIFNVCESSPNREQFGEFWSAPAASEPEKSEKRLSRFVIAFLSIF
jgi:hypothetical protein